MRSEFLASGARASQLPDELGPVELEANRALGDVDDRESGDPAVAGVAKVVAGFVDAAGLRRIVVDDDPTAPSLGALVDHDPGHHDPELGDPLALETLLVDDLAARPEGLGVAVEV